MKWNRKTKKPKVKKVKEQPKLGDFKCRVRFALFPVKIGDKILWLEKYIKVWEFKKQYGSQEYTVSSGLLEDAVTTVGLFNERTITKYYSYEGWAFHSRELIHSDIS